MKKIFFDTKENNNKRRQEEFLALDPSERFMVFLKMVDAMAVFPTKARVEDKGNLVLWKKKKTDGI